MKMRDVRPGGKMMTVQLLGSGWAAVVMWVNDEDLPEPFWEPYDTGIGRYDTEREAMQEAVEWAVDMDIPLQDKLVHYKHAMKRRST